MTDIFLNANYSRIKCAECAYALPRCKRDNFDLHASGLLWRIFSLNISVLACRKFDVLCFMYVQTHNGLNRKSKKRKKNNEH